MTDRTDADVHDREGGYFGVDGPRCRKCRRSWPCPDADLVEMKPYTLYVCPTDDGRAHGTHWTGARNLKVATASDGYCRLCGALQVPEEKDDGTRWRVTFETDIGFGWHSVERETSRKRDALSQVKGLHALIAAGEPVRNVGLSRSVVAWEPTPLESTASPAVLRGSGGGRG